MYVKTIKTLLFFISLFSKFSLQIISSCSATQPCPPQNTACVDSFCQCTGDFILDCLTPAMFLTDTFQTLTLNNQTQYLQTKPSKPDVYYDFMFSVCLDSFTNQNYALKFNLWVDTGITVINTGTSNFVGSVSVNLVDLDNAGQCVELVQYQIKIQKQPNGQAQNLIVGMDIQPIFGNDDNSTATIRIKVTTKDVISSQLLLKLAIAIVSVGVFVVLCAIAFCCYRRWKKKKDDQQKLSYKQQLVQQFKKNTPQVLANSIHIPSMTTCSICLGQLQPTQKVRKIVCSHIFHSECIDSWCLKNLNCPICRLDLDEQSLKNKKREIEMTDYNWQENSLSARQGLIQGQVVNENKSTSRNQ